MSITEELRKFAWKECPSKFLERVIGIADDIDAALADHIQLPKDADEVPIHVGDVVEWVDEPDVSRVVSSIHLAGDGWWVFVGGTGRRPDKHRHVKPDSWERIIRDAQGDGILNQIDGRPSDFEALVERCKRLAGESS